jgi:hypothetical protein
VKNYKNILLWGLSIFAILMILPIEDSIEQDTHTERFCAYGHVYVEFRKGSKIWGTTFLDEFGKPISCDTGLEKINTGRLIS